jgi:hypothetical protein
VNLGQFPLLRSLLGHRWLLNRNDERRENVNFEILPIQSKATTINWTKNELVQINLNKYTNEGTPIINIHPSSINKS